ncbi:MAG: DUF6687 family protein [Bacteroidia bacterium]|nr:DUF6687 family protein [Bacteroidia bacterium]
MDFLPFHEVKNHKEVVIVDSYFKGRIMLSHWRGAAVPDGLADDSSTGIVLNAIKAGHASIHLPFVSNNHFDIDGFLGIWALKNPKLALEYEDLLREAALIGDFREWKTEHSISTEALKLCCWINSVEREIFYEPFGEKDEATSCVPKYDYFLPRLAAFLLNPDRFKDEWTNEFHQILEQQKVLKSKGNIERLDDIHLQTVSCPEPIHYYVLFQDSSGMDMVLSLYEGNRYELEYKYVSWVDTADRHLFPRLPFEPLAEKLNKLEANPYEWEFDSIMDTGPMLRLNKKGLTKAERFAHPFNRKIYASSIPPEEFRSLVISYYREALSGIEARKSWSWKEMREVISES